MIERSTTPGILSTEAIAENRFCEVLHSFGMELLERNLPTVDLSEESIFPSSQVKSKKKSKSKSKSKK